MEYSKGMFEQARRKTEELGNVKLQQGDITDMPFPDKHFAGITINQVLLVATFYTKVLLLPLFYEAYQNSCILYSFSVTSTL